MALTLNAEQKSIYQIFSGENQYIIPPYQRAYSWTMVQCKALFEDIKKAFYNSEQEGYFLGNIVLAKSIEERNKLEVIDGQQRLASLTLLLKVLLSFDKDNKALYSAIWIKDRRTEEEIQRLETNVFMEKDFNYFKDVLAFDFSTNVCDSVKKEDNLFKQNICYFYNELKEFQEHNDIFKFADFLLDSVYILPIETEDTNADKARKNALQVFETINNRGLDLSTSDIFKARLYSMALNELEHKDFIIKWKELVQYCNELNLEIDNIFKIYSYIIRGEQGIIGQEIGLREFFLEKKYSPFFHKQYNEIVNDLLQITSAIKLYKSIDPNKYKEIAKLFQTIEQFKDEKMNIVLIIYLYKNNLNLDSDLIEFCLNFIQYIEKKEAEYKKDLDYNLFSYQSYYSPFGHKPTKHNYNELIIDILHNRIFWEKK